VASGANDHRGIVHRVREARRAYRGPFTGKDVQKVVSNAGYSPAYETDAAEFLIFVKAGRRPVPVNPNWEAIWDDDPIFRCLRRDLGFSRGKLRTYLNQARTS
jgi:hypothetical protein